MEDFEVYLQNAINTSAIPRAVVAVVDKHNNFIYKHTACSNGVTIDAKPLEFNQVFFVASCTKLIATIAALQLVECGLVSLDDAIDEHLPELASQPIIEQQGSDIKLREANTFITVRQLLTHSSGATYDWIDPKLYAWRASRSEAIPTIVSDGDVAKGYAYPRSLLVERLTRTNFEKYVEANIAKPLGITSFTWHLNRKPLLEAKFMHMSTRQDDGSLADGQTPFWPDPVKEGGGAGMCANVADFTHILSDLLKESPALLQKQTVDQMFSPQFPEGSLALKALNDNGEYAYACALDASMEGVILNFALGSLLLVEDVDRENYFKPKGTLSWTGLPNLMWSVNRERGLALFFATQVVPWGDRKTSDVIARFETAVWRSLTS